MSVKIRKPVNLTQDQWDYIEEQRRKENRSSYHNMIDTMIKAYRENKSKGFERVHDGVLMKNGERIKVRVIGGMKEE